METPRGLIAAWFGGEYEGHKEVNIYSSRFVKDKWTKPSVIADGYINDSV